MIFDTHAACAQLEVLVNEWQRWQRIDRIVRAMLGSLTLMNCTLLVGVVLEEWPFASFFSLVCVVLVALLAVASVYTGTRTRSAFVLFDDKLASFGREVDLLQGQFTPIEYVPEGA